MSWFRKPKAEGQDDKLASLQEQVEEMEETLRNKDTIITVLIQEKDELTKRISTMEEKGPGVQTKERKETKSEPHKEDKPAAPPQDNSKHKQEIAAVLGQKQKLENENRTLQETLKGLETERSSLKGQLTTVTETSNAALRKAQQYETEIRSLKTQLAASKAQGPQASMGIPTGASEAEASSPIGSPRDLKELKQQMRKQASESRKKDREIKLLKSEIEDLKRDLLKRTGELTALQLEAEKANADAAKTILFHNKQIERVQSREKRSQGKRDDDEKELKETKKELLRLRNIVDNSDKAKLCEQQKVQIDNLKTQMARDQHEAQEAKKAVDKKLATMKAIVEEQKRKTESNDRRIEKLVDVERQYNQLISMGNIEEMSETIKKQELELKSMKDTRDEEMKQREVLQSELDSSKVENSNQASKLSQLSNEVKKEKENNRKQKAKIEQTKFALEESEREKEILQNELVTLKTAKDVGEILAEEKSKLQQEHQKELDNAQKSVEDVKLKHSKEMDRLQEKHDKEIEKQKRDLQIELETLRRLKEKSDTEAGELQEKHQKALNEIQEKHKVALSGIQSRLDSSERKYKEREAEIHQKYEKEIASLGGKHKTSIEDLKRAHEESMSELKLAFETSRTGDQAAIDALIEKEREKNLKLLKEKQRELEETKAKASEEIRKEKEQSESVQGRLKTELDATQKLLESEVARSREALEEAKAHHDRSMKNTIEVLKKEAEDEVKKIKAEAEELRCADAREFGRKEASLRLENEATEKMWMEKVKMAEAEFEAINSGSKQQLEEIVEKTKLEMSKRIVEERKIWQDLEKELENARKDHDEELRTKKEQHASEIKTLKDQVEKSNKDHEKMMSQQKEGHKAYVNDIKEAHQKLVDTLEQRIEDMKKSHSEDKQQLTKDHAEKISKLVLEHNEKLSAEAEKHQQDLEKAFSKLSSGKQELEEVHQREIQEIRTAAKSHDVQVAAEKEKLANEIKIKQSTIEKLQVQVQEIQRASKDERENEAAARKKELEILKDAHANELVTALAAAKRTELGLSLEVKAANERHTKTVEEISKSHNAQLMALREAQQKEVEQLEAQWKQRLSNEKAKDKSSMEEQHSSKMSDFLKERDEKEIALKEKFQKLEDELREKLSAAEKKILTLETQSGMSKELLKIKEMELKEQLKAAMEAHTQTKVKFETSKKISERELQGKDETIAKLKADLEGSQSRGESLQREVSTLESGRLSALDSAEKEQKENQRLKEEVETAKNELAKCLEKLEATEKRAKEAERKHSAAKATISEKEAKIKKDVTKMTRARNKTSMIFNDMQQLRDRAREAILWSTYTINEKMDWVVGEGVHVVTIRKVDVHKLSSLEGAHLIVSAVSNTGRPLGRACRTELDGQAQIVMGPRPSSEGPFVFIELKHSKKKKNFVKMSTRGFAYYNPYEAHEKKSKVELIMYEKPTEFTRDASKLHSRGKIGKLEIECKLIMNEDTLTPKYKDVAE